MSVCSSRTSHVALMRNSLANRNSIVDVSVKIKENIVKSALNELLNEGNSRAYEDLVRTLRDHPLNERNAVIVLNDCSLCVGVMGCESKLLVEVLFTLNWNTMSEKVIELFSNWVLELLTSQINHAPLALGSLMKLLAKSDEVWLGNPSLRQAMMYSHVHNLIAQIVSIIPMSTEVLIRSAIDNFPYHKCNPCINQAYTHNLLWITRYIPTLTDDLLTLILNRLIIIDVNIKNTSEIVNNDVFDIEMEDKTDELIESLDLCMIEVFQWIDQNGSEILDLLFSVFQRVILPTYGTRNLQFIMLYGLSKDVRRVPDFLEILWQLVPSARVGPGPRQASIAHLAGLLARATYVDTQNVKIYIKKMTEWCHSYIKAQEMPSSHSGKNPHSVFYSVCQYVFYLVAFKHKELFSDKNGLIFVVSLNLPKIVMCSLNPLRMCHEGIAEAFASITRIHQIVYCHALMEQNLRRHLRAEEESLEHQEWFPYDPYTLPKSSKWILPLYKEYEETVNDVAFKNVEICGEEDDFLATSPNLHLSKSSFNSLRHIN